MPKEVEQTDDNYQKKKNVIQWIFLPQIEIQRNLK